MTGEGETMKQREPRKLVQIKYNYKGETYVIAEEAHRAIDRLESLTGAGAKIVLIEQFSV